MIEDMDDRRKQITELEQRKREQGVSLDALLTRLGEALLGRVKDSSKKNNSAFGELELFKRLKNDIADSETAIQTVEEQIRRFRELEETIEAKEQENNAGSKELAIVYGRLGKLLLDLSADAQLNGAGSIAGDFVDFCVPYRDQADTLYTKVLSLEERLSGLEERDGGNVFTWIGKNAQGMVLRSFLTKAQDSLEQLYRNVGERYGRRDNNQLMDNTANSGGSSSEGVAVAELCAEIERRQADARVLLQELTDLKEERKEISGSFNAEGGPLKQIQTLKNNIAHVQDELKALYRRIGAEAAGIDGVERRDIINTLVKPEDQESLDNAVQISRLIRENERAIEKLQASLAIDDEKEKIEKYRKMIQEKKDKIAQAEKNITEYEEGIRVSETAIEKLQSLL